MELSEKSTIVDFLCRRIKNKKLRWLVMNESVLFKSDSDKCTFRFKFLKDLSEIKEIYVIQSFNDCLVIHFDITGIKGQYYGALKELHEGKNISQIL